MTRYVPHAWWHRGLPALALLVAVPCAGLGLHEHRSATSWRHLEKQREQLSTSRVARLDADVAALQTRATRAEARVTELAGASASAGDRTAELQVLAERAASTETALSSCTATMDATCTDSVDDALSVLRALQRLDAS
ncbi:MAG: hypothetical protein JWN17_209 [Frankiales bacterium]|nr:hypothetical protein [Frankiales bacterium]